MSSKVVAAASASRWARGIANPNPVRLAALRALLEREPSMSKAELARRTGIGRSTLPYYLRAIADDIGRARQATENMKTRRMLTHVDLVERVAATADEIRAEVARLRGAKGVQPGAVFAGYRTSLAAERLLAELLGEIQPPAANTYVLQVAALLDQPIDASALSSVARAALGMEADATRK